MTGLVLVTGASGTVGAALVKELLATGQNVRAGVRDPTAARLPAGVQPIRLDLTEAATAAPAMVGVDRLFLLRPPAISAVGTAFAPLVDAAVRGGVRRVVVLSVMGVNPALPHWRLERLVRRAGLPLTALRPAYFAQNLLTAYGEDIRVRSHLPLAAGDGKVSFIDTRDIAAVAALVLTDPESCEPGPITLTGPEALSFGDAAALLGAELGRPVTYLRQSLLGHRRTLRLQGAEPAYVRVQLAIDLTTRLGLAAKVTRELPRLLGRPALSLARFLHDHRDAWL